MGFLANCRRQPANSFQRKKFLETIAQEFLPSQPYDGYGPRTGGVDIAAIVSSKFKILPSCQIWSLPVSLDYAWLSAVLFVREFRHRKNFLKRKSKTLDFSIS